MGVLIVLFLSMWAVAGAIAILIFLDCDIWPTGDRFKDAFTAAVCGPLAWLGALAGVGYYALREWLEKEK